MLINLNIFSSQLTSIFTDEINTYNVNSLKQLSQSVDTVINTCENITTTLASKNTTEIFMNSNKYNLLYPDHSSIRSELINYISIYQYIDSIFLYSLESDILICESDTQNQILEWFDYKDYTNTSAISIYSQFKYDNFPSVITVLRPFFDYKNEKFIGFIAVNIDTFKLSEMIKSEKNLFSFFLVNNNGNIIYSTVPEYLTQNAQNINCLKNYYKCDDAFTAIYSDKDAQYTVNVKNSQFKNIKYISLSYMNYYKDIKNRTVSYLLKNIIILILCSIILSCIVSWHTYKPFAKITNMLSVSYGKGLKNEINELEFILKNIDMVINKNNELSEQLDERFKLLKQANFFSLQSQINPHFLFNTIDNIRWLAIAQTGTNNVVSQSLFSLAKLLRTSSNYSGFFVTINDEISYTKEYVNLLQLKFNHNVNCLWEIDENILNYKIIRMCLQPIIENSYEHGIKPKDAAGLITVCGFIDGNDIVMTVTDNGIGIPENELKALNLRLADNNTTYAEHIGLNNVNQRICLIFGNNYHIKISKRDDGKQGVTVTLRIPQSSDFSDNLS